MSFIQTKFTTKVEKNIIPEVKARMEALSGLVTKVGYPEGEPVGSPQKQTDEPPLTQMSEVARIAFTLEFGAPHLGDKKWPTMSKAFLKDQLKTRTLARRLFIKVTEGRLNPMKALGIIGEFHAENIREEIRMTRTPALEESTIQKKGSSKPLIDTGQMIQSVAHKEGKR
tara:strand:+ start:4926 stop:5435 length:510 start_codon:yes stop_codon:yes gene_type:complete